MEPPSSTRKPNPRPFAVVLLVAALFGGPCAMQDAIRGPGEVPSQQDARTVLQSLRALPKDATPEQVEKAATSTRSFMEAQSEAQRRVGRLSSLFAGILAVAYSLVFIFAFRAAQMAPNAARQLSFVSFLLLLARVATAAVSLAITRNLQPAMQELGRVLASMSPGVPPAEAEHVGATVGHFFSRGALTIQAFWALLVLVLFSQAWRYFGKPEVQELYKPIDSDFE